MRGFRSAPTSETRATRQLIASARVRAASDAAAVEETVADVVATGGVIDSGLADDIAAIRARLDAADIP